MLASHKTAGHERAALRARAAKPYHLKTGGYGPGLYVCTRSIDLLAW